MDVTIVQVVELQITSIIIIIIILIIITITIIINMLSLHNFLYLSCDS